VNVVICVTGLRPVDIACKAAVWKIQFEDSCLLGCSTLSLDKHFLIYQIIIVPSHSRSSSLFRLLDLECEGTLIL
jgi:hypothetical protein